jgi:hypothetical protein
MPAVLVEKASAFNDRESKRNITPLRGVEDDMNVPPSFWTKLPPHLSMDEYADFVEASLRECDPDKVKRQKEIEKKIKMPFRISEDKPCSP